MPFQEIEVAEINQNAGRLTQNKDRVLLIDGIGQQRHTTCNAKPPEGKGDNAAFFAFACDPLDDKARREDSLSAQSEN